MSLGKEIVRLRANEQEEIKEIKSKMADLIDFLEKNRVKNYKNNTTGRVVNHCFNRAIEKIEESCMFAVKGISTENYFEETH